MATDIVPELLDAIQEDFDKLFKNDDAIKFVRGLIRNGSATYSDMNAYAIRTGELLADVFKKHLNSDSLPDGKMYYNIAERILTPTLKNNHEIIATAAAETQELLNKSAGIGIKAIKANVNNDRISGLIEKVSEADKFDDVAWVLDQPIVNFGQHVVDETARTNADFHSRSGLSPTIRRTMVSETCDWCEKLAGVYNYEDVKRTGHPVFMRHRKCDCLVEYDPRDGTSKINAHTKKVAGSREDKAAQIELMEKREARYKKEEEKKRKARIAKAKQV